MESLIDYLTYIAFTCICIVVYVFIHGMTHDRDKKERSRR